MINLTWLFVLIWLLLLFVHACQNVGLCELWRPINVKLEVTTWLWWAQVRTCIVVVILIVIAIIANYVNVLFIRVGTRRWGCKEKSRKIKNLSKIIAAVIWRVFMTKILLLLKTFKFLLKDLWLLQFINETLVHDDFFLFSF